MHADSLRTAQHGHLEAGSHARQSDRSAQTFCSNLKSHEVASTNFGQNVREMFALEIKRKLQFLITLLRNRARADVCVFLYVWTI